MYSQTFLLQSDGRRIIIWYALKPFQSQNARSVFACLNLHVHTDPNTDKHSHSTTHPERLVRRGWRRQAGVRSTWPPLLTACCRRSQLKSVFCWRMPESGASFMARLPPLWRSSRGIESPVALLPNVVCQKRKRKRRETPMLAEQLSSLFIYRKKKKIGDFSSKKHNRWMHHGFIILARSPYGIVGFKVLSSDWVQVAQSPVSWTHTGCDQPNTKTVRTTKCILGYSVVVCSSMC